MCQTRAGGRRRHGRQSACYGRLRLTTVCRASHDRAELSAGPHLPTVPLKGAQLLPLRLCRGRVVAAKCWMHTSGKLHYMTYVISNVTDSVGKFPL
jgi:hypothetical protein